MSNKQPVSECQHGLSEISVQVICESKNLTVPGLVHKDCPGLAVTMSPFGCFTVTHINSGLKICHQYQRASSALLVMSQFGLVAAMRGKSWSELDKASAFELIRDAGSDEVPFDGCTSTSKDGTRKMTVREWFQVVRIPIMDEFGWEDFDPFETAIDNFEKIEVPG